MKLALRAFCAAVTVPFLLGACTDDDPQTLVTAKGAALVRAQGCDDLLVQIQEDAIAKLNLQADRYKNWRDYYYDIDEDGNEAPTAGRDDVDFDIGGDGDSTSAPDVPMGNGSISGEGDDGESSGDPKAHSDTNTQVEDVDEADIVKVSEDGKRLFVLHGSKLKVVQSWPAEELSEAASVEVPGRAFEMFVHGDKATVFSYVNPAGIADKGDAGPLCADCCSHQEFTQISVFDASGATPTLEREMIFEGDYVSSRLYGDTVRAVVRGGFSGNDLYYPYIDLYDSFGRQKSDERIEQEIENWRAGVEADIRGSTLADWIPRAYEKEDGEWSALSEACDGYYIPAPGYVTSGVTRVVTFDMDENAAPSMTSVLGGSDVIYSNTEHMVITQHNWMWDEFGEDDGSKTSVHAFSLDGAATVYEASGFAPGYLENQFSIHEKDGAIFVSTTEESEATDWEPRNTIVSMKKGESGSLEMLDRSADLGEKGETIFATRFLGDRAYVVTFLQTDPLYAVDISVPTDIQVLGELHIPGFSEYIHPLGKDHLLTIGVQNGAVGRGTNDLPGEIEGDGDASGDGDGVGGGTGDSGSGSGEGDSPSSGGTSTGGVSGGATPDEPTEDPVETNEEGIALQIFDVKDPTNPKLVHKEIFDSSFYSEALYNHKAFTFVDDYFDTDSSLLMFPLNTYSPNYRVGLQVTKVSVEDGFEDLGNIDHSSLLQQGCEAEYGEECYYGEDMRRGIQIDQYIYALSDGGLSVHSVEGVAGQSVAELAFEAPVYTYDSCDYYYDGKSTPGGWEDGGDGDISVDVPPSTGMGGESGGEEGVEPAPDQIEPAPDQTDPAEMKPDAG